MASQKESPTLPFASATLWEEWLSKHHSQVDGVWIKVAKKATGIASVTHDEALDVALCYGGLMDNENPVMKDFSCKNLRHGVPIVYGRSVTSIKWLS